MRCGNGPAACACVVEGNDGIAVTGDGTPETPYLVGLGEALATSLDVVDTATVDLALTGDGTSGNPFELTADVNDGTVVPESNGTLDIVGAQVNAPIVYSAGTREFSVALSADDGNSLAMGTDNGLYAADSGWVAATVTGVVGGGQYIVDITGGPTGAGAQALVGLTFIDDETDIAAIPKAGGGDYLLIGKTP